ncbi:MAG: hypothetical protein EBS05_23590 [Proteobacteria bacterium]|nr:hypothetical protein [Pseudomonadota bacterium]
MFLRAALVKPRFHTVLDDCCEFGLDRVRTEWEELAVEGTPKPAGPRMLRNIELGFADAATGQPPRLCA